MNESLHPNRRDMPSTSQLMKATSIAIVVAGVILTTIVLPAEYGIDPTGFGSKLGLMALSTGINDVSEPQSIAPTVPLAPSALIPGGVDQWINPVAASSLSPAWRSPAPFRTETQTLVLQPNEGAEIKAHMKEGEHFVFGWKTDGGDVEFDMHGDKLNAAPDEFTSYWKDKGKSEGHGAFRAPFNGKHGWYWRNRTDKPVTITLQVNGYFEKLFRL